VTLSPANRHDSRMLEATVDAIPAIRQRAGRPRRRPAKLHADSESYVLVCHRYVESNPVRADLVSRPEDYPWSSYRHNALGTKDPLLREHATYTALGATVAARRAAYRELFGPGLTDEQVETIRDATQRGWVPGNDRFRQQVERVLGRRVDPPIRGRPPKAPAEEKLAAKAK